MQPIPNLHATHNNVLPYPDVSHPEFFSADIPPRRLTSGILPPPPFHPDASHPEFHPANVLPYPDVSHPELSSADIPSGCLASGILLCRYSIRMSRIRNSSLLPHSTRMPRIRNSSPPTFHPDISHLEFCPADIPHFSSYLEHFL
ncbi:hypothetical protein VitviT2T_013158 [Vitis vinifera]|uniref:Uncharacterized protein n=1 Tax=Vitis vinifera TaxID=29760 RepID=A0ABY9CIE4_VITVI|nr:hypothetical protein VitviT2T_013158 [Vitis vinifera]